MADGTLKVGTITTSSGSGTITLGQSGETITIPSGVTLSGGVTNTPSFFARVSGNFSVSDNSTTLLPFATENFDTDNAFDNTASNYKFTVPSGKAGKYYFASSIRKNNDSLDRMVAIWRINGSTVREVEHGISGSYAGWNGSIMFDLNVGDYVQVYLYAQHSSASTVNLGTDTWFMGYKLL